jgi:hypothetical protein
MAASLPQAISDASGCVISQRLLIAATSVELGKTSKKSFGVKVLKRSAFRGSDRFTATVSIRQK